MDNNKGILKPMSAAEKITAISPKEKTPPINVSYLQYIKSTLFCTSPVPLRYL